MTQPHSITQGGHWNNRRVTVMGLGRHGGGVGVTRYLATRGASVTVSDVASADALAESLAQLADLPDIRFHLGGHHEDDFAQAEVVVINPAVQPGHRMLELARQSGAELTSEIEIFLRACPAPIIGVTGSSGKSTTAAMIAAILEQAKYRCWLGGNIGVSLLGNLPEIAPTDWVVLELSSFQLAHLNPGVSMPSIATITNCAPNHLDWHSSYDDYRAAKQRLIREQRPDDLVVLNQEDAEVASWRSMATGNYHTPCDDADIPELRVIGAQNRQNARLAARVAQLVGVGRAAIDLALRAYRALPHRLEYVGERAGRRFWNDSKSTTPAATIAALSALAGPTWLLAGGISKGADFSQLAKVAARSARGIALFGRDRQQLFDALVHAGCKNLHLTDDLRSAFDWCVAASQPGDNILLSPACASMDQFKDYIDRGRQFCSLVARVQS
jgi:UDP-N-acetylmuramoylalanine--D-glutamate ligase